MDEAKDSISALQVTDHEILTGCIDGKVRRYDLRVGKMYSDFIGSAVTSAKFSKDGQCILSSSHDNTLRLLDVSTGEMLDEGVVLLWFLMQENIKMPEWKISMFGSFASFSIFSVISGEYTGHKNSKYMIECSLNRKDDHVLSGSEDGFVYIWDLIEANIVKQVNVKANKVIHSMCLHPEEEMMVVACEDKVYFYADENYEMDD